LISGMVLQLYSDGKWDLSLHAAQNPVTEEGLIIPAGQTERYTAHLRRNQFVVQLQCLGPAPIVAPQADDAAAAPALAPLGPMRFWVQRGHPRRVVYEGYDPTLVQNFHRVEKVELEFFYYH
jgi:hypothetical protein